MNGLALVVDASSIQRNRNENVTGGIHLEIDDTQFPSATWHDFPVIVLGWWAQALLALVEGDAEVQDLNFMDGPYVIRITPLESDQVQIECCKRRASDTSVVYSASLSLSAFLQTFLAAATRVERHCVEQGWLDLDVKQLQDGVANLKRLSC
jgi:hypothetical protein